MEKGAKNWVVFRDNTFDLEFLRRADELRDGGLYVELAPYGYQTFLNWREVRDEHGWYEKIAEKIGGRGVPSVARAIQEMLVAPLLEPFSLVCDADLWTDLLGERAGAMDELETRLQRFADSVAQFSGVPNDKKSFAQAVGGRVAEAVSIADARNFSPDSVQNEADLIQNEGNSLEKGIHSVQSGVDEEIFFDERAIWLGYAILAEVGRLAQSENPRAQSVIWVREWLLSEAVEKTWAHMGLDAPGEAIVKVKLALLAGSLADEKPLALLNALLAEDDAQWLLGINNFEGVLWFNGDGATQLLDFLAQAQAFENAHWPLETLRDAMENSGFRVVKWMELARGEQSDSSPSALPVTS